MSYILISSYDEEVVNSPEVPSKLIEQIIIGFYNVCKYIVDIVRDMSLRENVIIGIDGYIGVEWSLLISKLKELLRDVDFEILHVLEYYKSSKHIENIIKGYLECDPFFGKIFEKRVEEFLEGGKLRKSIEAERKQVDVLICLGPGVVNKFTLDLYNLILYIDVTKEVAGRRVLKGFANNLGGGTRGKSKEYVGKRLYYIDFPVLDRHKQTILRYIDFYLSNNETGNLVMLPREIYRKLLLILAENPLRLKPIYLEGVWGGQWLKKVRNLPKSMVNCAWSYEVMAPYQSLKIRLGEIALEIPFLNLLWEYPDKVMGNFEALKKTDGNFPIRVNYDDSMGGGDMAIQVHGNLSYLRENFNEPIGQNESYYIVATGPGAKTYFGLKDNIDVRELYEKAREAETGKKPFNHNLYISSIPSREGDLLLIPAGTVHASGGNQVVLEISDTTDLYTFHIYDYLRPDLNGKLRPIHIYHAFNVLDETKRASWVLENLKAKPYPIRFGDTWAEYFLGELGELHILIHRLEFLRKIDDNTNGRFHILTLVGGECILIKSKLNFKRRLEISFSETAIIPACFGEYMLINLGKSPCKVVKAFMR